VSLRRERGLAEGMAVAAAIEARILGLRLLSLRAIVDVLPAEATTVERGNVGPVRPRPLPARGRSKVGSRLAEASRAIKAGGLELEQARDRMP